VKQEHNILGFSEYNIQAWRDVVDVLDKHNCKLVIKNDNVIISTIFSDEEAQN